VAVAVIGQAFLHADRESTVPSCRSGRSVSRRSTCRRRSTTPGAAARARVVLLSHNGTDVDLKLAGRVRGLDAILGGHTHDGLPRPIVVKRGGSSTLVTKRPARAASSSRCSISTFAAAASRAFASAATGLRDLLAADAEMDALITRVRAPWEARLAEPLAVTEGLLYRRGNFNGPWTEVLLDALMTVKGAQIGAVAGLPLGRHTAARADDSPWKT